MWSYDPAWRDAYSGGPEHAGRASAGRSAVGDAQAPVQPGAVGPLDFSVAGGPEAPGAARAAVVRGLTGRVADRVLIDAELLALELVTNKVRHAGLTAEDRVRIGAVVTDGTLLLEAKEAGGAGTLALRTPGLNDAPGLGLPVVEALAQREGVARNGHTQVGVEASC
jgi:anti-sigma regulatory factor (Ser/Thr protein kinase)